MDARIEVIRTRFDALKPYQRMILLTLCMLLLFLVADSVALEPAFRKQHELRQAITDWELRLELLRQRSGLLHGDHDSATAKQLDNMLSALTEVETEIRERIGVMLEPVQAVKILEQVLEQEEGLELLEVTASSAPLYAAGLHAGSPAAGNMYRYYIQLQMEGSYLATLRYLRALERLPWKFFWESMDYQVTDHPSARITLDIYTLGLQGVAG